MQLNNCLGMRRVLKILVMILALWPSTWVLAHGENDTNEAEITPEDLDREEYIVPWIDTENAEVSIFGGGINFDNFNTKGSYGASLAYHINEDMFLELSYLESEVSDFELRSLGAPQLPSVEEPVYYTSLSLGMNMLPGEIFILDRWVFSSTFYLIGGVGNTNFADDDKFTFNVGFGYRVYLTDWLSLRLEARDHMFDNEIQGEEALRHNFEFRLGTSIFF